MRSGEARTEGLNHIEGEYIGWVDADDFISPLTFEYSYKCAKKDNVDLLEFQHSRFGGRKKKINKMQF